MSELSKIMSTDVERLYMDQHDALQDHVIDTLRGIIDDITERDYQSVYRKLAYSAAGDGYGSENHFINFNWTEKDDPTDIGEAISTLMNLLEKGQQ